MGTSVLHDKGMWIRFVWCILVVSLLGACGGIGQKKQSDDNENITENTMYKVDLENPDLEQLDKAIEAYMARDKFVEGELKNGEYYPGLEVEELRTPLNEILNLIADDFREVAHHEPASWKYRDIIASSLSALSPVYLDSEDRDQLCFCIEELMDIVGLVSSGGLLNDWRYGFNPE